ncbi:MAG: UDP-4-amino-4,6-dideoxy-N-acetyl-beta-L-altrosamine transaminase [Alphaproteobacteria bacterium]
MPRMACRKKGSTGRAIIAIFRQMKRFIPYARQAIDQSDIDAVVEVLKSDFLTTGPAIDDFEAAFSGFVGGGVETVSCSSGTAALHLAYAALGFGPGDAVIVPSVTFVATANAARLCGAEVIFADTDPVTGLMTVETAEDALNRALPEVTVRAIAPVHLNGQPCDMPGLAAFAEKHDLSIVVDGCHALGSSNAGAGLVGDGRFGEITTFSFHPVKAIAMGEGGAVTTADPVIAKSLRRLRSHGLTRDPDDYTGPFVDAPGNGRDAPWFYEMPDVGLNYRASDIHAALGLSQMKRLPAFIAARRTLHETYDALFAADRDVVASPIRFDPAALALHLYPVLIDFEKNQTSRTRVMKRLRDKGVGTQVHYIPVHKQPYYIHRYGDRTLPGAETYYDRALSIPYFVGLQTDEQAYVVEALREAIKPE